MKYNKLLSSVMLMALSLMAVTSEAQMCPYPSDNCNTCVTINLPPDPTICQGSSYTFNLWSCIVPSGMTISGWSWTPSTGVSPASGSYPSLPGTTVLSPTTTTSYALTVTALGPNLINDGDFSTYYSFAPCFYTDYNYYAYSPSTAMTYNQQYAVGTNPNLFNSYFFQSMGDHTTGTGNMLIVNGSTTVSPTPVVWEEDQVPVCPGQTYQFTMWYANIDPAGGGMETANLQVVIDGTTYGTYTPTASTTWYPVNISWTAPAGTSSISIKILDINTWDNYNDFAIDDISFNRVCSASAKFKVYVETPSVSGPDKVCTGNTISLTGAPAGGTWSSSGPGATVDASGNVTGVSAGTTIISYTSPSGCVATKKITVYPNTIVISGGPSTVCNGQSLSLTATPTGGTWSATPELASSGPVGGYYGTINGVGTVTYTQGGCYATKSITVNPTPGYLPTMYDCIGDVLMLHDNPPGGTWTCSPVSVATITPGGSLTCTAPGAATITYTLPTGCAVTTHVNVYNCDSGVILGPSVMCQGSNYTFIGLPAGGTWSSSDPAILTIDASTGSAYAVSGGVVTVTYTVGGIVKTFTVTVNPPETADASEVVVGGIPYVNFTSSCTSPGCTIYYKLYDITWHPLGPSIYTTYTTSPGMLAYSTIYGFPGCSTAYYLCIVGVYCNGCYWPINYDCFNLNDPNWHPKPQGTAVTAAVSNLSVMPNPNSGVFSIRGTLAGSEDNKEAVIEVIDMMGKTIYTDVAELDNGQMNKDITLSSGMANGTYLVRIKSNGASEVLRFVLDR